jgi:DNA-binding GntR family transcriptional regulator
VALDANADLPAVHSQGPGLRKIASWPKLSYRVSNQIRDAIMSGLYIPGQKLAVEHVASQLAVSSMPVREAFVALANEGVLDVLPHRGFAVAPISPEDIRDIFRVHAFIGGVLAERASGVISDQVVERLRAIQKELEEVAARGQDRDELARIGDLNFEFHRTINKLVDSGRLLWFLRAVTSYVPRDVYEAIPGWSLLAVTDHPRVIKALADRDPEAARTLTEVHVTKAGEKVMEHLAARGFWG